MRSQKGRRRNLNRNKNKNKNKMRRRPPTKKIVVVSRHPALLQYLREDVGIEMDNSETIEVLEHTFPECIRGLDIIGNPPLFLASQARTVTTFSVHVPLNLRGKRLDIEQIRELVKAPTTYIVQKVPTPERVMKEMKNL